MYGQPGEVVEARDWDPAPHGGGGLHGLLEADGDWMLLNGSQWLVIEADSQDIVTIDSSKCKFRRGKILYRGGAKGLSQYTDRLALTSRAAFYWADNIGNRKIMRDRITDSIWAHRWAVEFGDHDVMRDRVVDSEGAYWWAYDFGDYDIMRDRVVNSQYAYRWACDIGDRDVMRDRVVESKWVYLWILNIGDYEIMAPRITDPFYADLLREHAQ